MICIDDRQWADSQKRLFRTFVFQSTRYLSSSTGNSGNGLIFDDEDEESLRSSSTSNKQLVLIEVSSYFYYLNRNETIRTTYLSILREKKEEKIGCLSSSSVELT